MLPFLLPLLMGSAGAAAVPAAATALGTGIAAGAGAAGTAAGLAGLGTAATAASAPAVAGGIGALAAPTALTAAAPVVAAAPTTAAATGGLSALTGANSAAGSALLNTAVAPTALGTGTQVASLGAAVPGGAVTGLPTAGGGLVTPAAGAAGVSPVTTGSIAPAAAGTTAFNGATATGAATSPIKSGLAGLFGGMDSSKMLQYGAMAAMMMPKGGGGGDDKQKSRKDINSKDYSRGDEAAPDDGGISGGLTGEHDYFPHARYYAEGGVVDGGLASIAPPTGAKEAGPDDEKLIDAAAAAIQGQVPPEQAQPIIAMFVKEFGPQALEHLVSQLQAGQTGDGMSDSVPAQIEGQAPAQLSEGEYVVPSDVVSHLGNGSTGAGAKQLEGMVSRSRSARGAPSDGPAQIDPRAMMPQ